jgi:tetratricopeptide (TPR) repeat protein
VIGRLAIGGTAAVTAAAVLLLGGTLRGEADPRAGAGAQTLVEAALRDLQRVRETGDAAFYAPAERALRRALALEPRNGVALRASAALAASRHRFAESLAFAERARRVEPQVAAVYGLIGDANLELGRYEAAFAAFERQVAMKPTSSAYARVAYARELLGDTAGAISAMELAAEAAPPGEPAAWARAQLAALQLAARRPGVAARLNREALSIRPGYSAALEGLAKLARRQGRVEVAIGLLRTAAARSADPGPAIALGDALTVAGRKAEAARAYARAEERERRFAEFGGRTALETAEFDLNRDRRLRDALARARRGYRERPSVEGAHVVAWALYKNGRCGEARRFSIESFRLGTKDVDGLYHHSLIERCLGNGKAAEQYLGRVLELDPLYLRFAPSAFRVG